MAAFLKIGVLISSGSPVLQMRHSSSTGALLPNDSSLHNV